MAVATPSEVIMEVSNKGDGQSGDASKCRSRSSAVNNKVVSINEISDRDRRKCNLIIHKQLVAKQN